MAASANERVVGDGGGLRRGGAVHVGEEAEHEGGEGEAGEVREEGTEWTGEERAERRRGDGVEAEHDGERQREEVAGRCGGTGHGGGEAKRERDGERAR
jgi:hypothetical protein